MGILNAHTSVGNILGSLTTAALLEYGWGCSFYIPGLIIAIFGLVVFLLLPVSPETVGSKQEEDGHSSPKLNSKAITNLLLKKEQVVKVQPVGNHIQL